VKICHILPNLSFDHKKKGQDMANIKNEDMGLVKEIQKVLLDDRDFLRDIVQENLQSLLDHEFKDHINAEPYERTESRQGYRNGSYSRTLKTRVGSIELAMIRDREGQFSTELFRRYQRHEQAFVLSMIEMYLQGVSTRKVKKVTETLCGTDISKSTVSSLAQEIDANIERWRDRPLSKSYPYLMVDARYEDIRQDGVVTSQAVLIVVGISTDGRREILALDIGNSEHEQEWGAVFKRLKARGLHGVKYTVSDDHSGLVKALKREFQGSAWQRCQVHFQRNFRGKFSRRERDDYGAKLKDVFAATGIEQARQRQADLVRELEPVKPRVAEWLDQEIESCFTVYSLPGAHQKRMRTTNMIERFNQELLRRSRVIRIFPNAASCIRLFAAMCIEKSEHWQTGYKYLEMSLLPKQQSDSWELRRQAV
jgi:transposase-like protein